MSFLGGKATRLQLRHEIHNQRLSIQPSKAHNVSGTTWDQNGIPSLIKFSSKRKRMIDGEMDTKPKWGRYLKTFVSCSTEPWLEEGKRVDIINIVGITDKHKPTKMKLQNPWKYQKNVSFFTTAGTEHRHSAAGLLSMDLVSHDIEDMPSPPRPATENWGPTADG